MGKVERVLCVYSTEKPGKLGLADLDESKVDDADQYASLPNFRSRILPVLGTMPALFGNAMATHVLTELAGFETHPIPFKATRKQIEKFYNELCQAEMTLNERQRLAVYFDFRVDMKVNADDIGFIFEEIWNCRSALGGSCNDRLQFLRWDHSKPAEFGNIVCLSKKEAAKHLKLPKDEFTKYYGQEMVDRIEKRLKLEIGLSVLRFA